ncbi:unnamed protein product [Discula destructiva]
MAILRALPLAALAATLVQGIAFTSPASSAVVTKGSEITATWTSVDTDPSVFSLYLWNFEQWPPYYEGLAYGVNTAAGEVTVRVPCHIDNGAGWQVTAINDTNVYVLYAQGATFNVTGDPCADPTTTAGCYAPTSTVFVTQTGAPTAAPTAASAAVPAEGSKVIQPGVSSGGKTKKPIIDAAASLLGLKLDVEVYARV